MGITKKEREKEKQRRIKKLNKSYKGIFKALSGLTNVEAVCQLECVKIDIILNDSLVILDGKSGKCTKGKNNFKE